MTSGKTIGDIASAGIIRNPMGQTNPETELSRRQTGMSFQRTRLSAERTLMSVVRTSLSLISFGFTIFQFFRHLQEKNLLDSSGAARNFGLMLVYLGVGLLISGLLYHIQFMWGLRHERRAMQAQGLIYAQSRFPVSFTLIAAVILLVFGIVAGANLTFRAGPFG